MFLLILGVILLFQIPSFQKEIANKFTKWVEKEYKVKVQLNRIKPSVLGNLKCYDFTFLNSNNDTLISFKELKIHTSIFRFTHFKKVYIEDLFVNYNYTDSLSDGHIYKAFESLFIPNTESNSIQIDNFLVNNAQLDIGNSIQTKSFRNINVYLKECLLSSDMEFVMSHLEFELLNGANHQFKARRILLSKNVNLADKFQWKSGSSLLRLDLMQNTQNDSIRLKFNDFKVDYYATKGLFKWPKDLRLEANSLIQTLGDSLWSENIKISTDNGSFLSGSFGIKNWRDIESWQYSLALDTFNLANDEWSWLSNFIPNTSQLSSLGDIDSDGSMKGSLSHLDLDLNLKSDQGNIDSEIFINWSDDLDDIEYNGGISFYDFNIDFFENRFGFKKLNGQINVDGKGDDISNFDTQISGNIKSLNIRDRQYDNIILNGRLQPNYFKGDAFVSDEDLEIEFSGEVDFSNKKPIMDFVANLIEVDLIKLNLYNHSPVAKLSSLIEINLQGSTWNNIEGDIGAYFTSFETLDNKYYYNDILLSAEKFEEKDVFHLQSDFLIADIDGQIDVKNVFSSFLSYLAPHFPFINESNDKVQDFDFDISILNLSDFSKLLIPNLDLANGTRFLGNFNNRREGLKLNVQSPSLSWDNFLFKNLNLNTQFDNQGWVLDVFASELDFKELARLQNISFNQLGAHGDCNYSLNWESSDSTKFYGHLKGLINMHETSVSVFSDESEIHIADTLWTLHDSSYLHYSNGKINSQAHMSSVTQEIYFSSGYNHNYDTIRVELDHFNLSNISPWISSFNSSLEGTLNADILLVNDSLSNKLYSDIFTSNLKLNNADFGVLNLNIDYDDIQEIHLINGLMLKDDKEALEFSGDYKSFVDSNHTEIFVDLHDFNFNCLQPYLPFFDDLHGLGTGYLNFYGDITEPKFEGELITQDVHFSVPYLNIDAKTVGSSILKIKDDEIKLDEFYFESIENGNAVGSGILSGKFSHNYFSDINMEVNLIADSLLILNTDAVTDKAYFGKVISSGNAIFRVQSNLTSINYNGVSEKGTTFSVPLDDDETIEDVTFIHFLDKQSNKNDTLLDVSEMINNPSNLIMNMNFELNENAQVNIIFDETIGNKISAKGSGFVNIGLNNANEVYMYGDYTVNKGDYLFTLQNFVNKKFEIESGANIVWDGSPYKAKLDLSALYKLTTNVNYLTQNPDYNRTSDVECRMLMTGDILKPSIEFDIQIPNADDQINRILEEQTNTEEKKTQQFLSLLVLNSFMSSGEYENTDVDYLSSTVSSGAEMLNNQLYNWTSQFSNRFDLGLKYNPNLGDSISNREFEVLLNNMKLNDRITINGNFGTHQNTSDVIADLKVEYKLSDDGKLRLVAFRNLEESFQLAPNVTNYTSGIGFFYTDEFKSLKDFWVKFRMMFRKKNNL